MRTKKPGLFSVISTVYVSLAILVAFYFIGKTYKAKYEEGYEAGRASVLETYDDRYDWDAYEDGVDSGYDIGYSDGLDDSEKADDLAYDIETAYDLAREKTGMSVYEAWNNVLLYYGSHNPYEIDMPTDAEFRKSVETLAAFCDYMYRIDLYR